MTNGSIAALPGTLRGEPAPSGQGAWPTGVSKLPIAPILGDLVAALTTDRCLVLQAPPGAGKTTGVPLAILGAPWLEGGRIIMLEPRRLAVRAAARRMADLLGEAVGATVGYRMRMDTRVGPGTRIEVVTDGVFTRMIQDDPELSGIGAVLFDEVHERRLDSDLGLALALEAQSALRPDLRLVAMSATLDAEPFARLMGSGQAPATILTAAGRAWPVEIRHRDAPAPNRLASAVVDAVVDALDALSDGGVLVFLPGAPEIRRVERLLRGAGLPPGVAVLPLYGDLPQAAQDLALSDPPAGRRHVVLATSIAETSLTIAGVRQVVDAGLARVGRFQPRTGMTRLETVVVTQAGADQRAGRAGRTAPGIAWRLWPAAAHKALALRPEPEIMLTDLAPLALELAVWGVEDPGALRLLDPPPPGGLEAARRLLVDLGALDAAHRITPHGRRLAKLGLSPRLAHMVLTGAARGAGGTAAALAAVLTEGDRGLDEAGSDLRAAMSRFAASALDGDDPFRRARASAKRLARAVAARGDESAALDPAATGRLLALAYADRVARRRREAVDPSVAAVGVPPGATRYRLSGGQGAWLPPGDPLAGEEWLVVADLDGQRPDARIWLAAPVDQEDIEASLADRLKLEDVVVWDPRAEAVAAERRVTLGALSLRAAALADPSADAVAAALTEGLRRGGPDLLPWTGAARALRARVAFLAARDPDGDWPALDDASLMAGLEDWLTPHLRGRRRLADVARIDLAGLLADRLDHARARALDRRAPTHLVVPSGSRIPIDYESGDVPVLSVRLQELFGLAATPAVDEGRVPLVLSLLSPAGRPIQTTRDLPGFWAGSYRAVRAELRGRYPRHPWPEDPLAAQPTARAKPRGT